MEPYLFEGVVLPERAQLSIEASMGVSDLQSKQEMTINISIVLNQVAVWVHSDFEWDIFDLRNIVRNLVSNELALLGYVKGYAYDLEITRVLHRSRKIDYVFGIDVPCIADKYSDDETQDIIRKIRPKLLGPEGILLNRCFNDLVMAMKHPMDTGFYCYRAIESLRHHCSQKFQLQGSDKNTQWGKLREVASCTKEDVMMIKDSADPVRHGEAASLSSDDRKELFEKTWTIVGEYIENS